MLFCSPFIETSSLVLKYIHFSLLQVASVESRVPVTDGRFSDQLIKIVIRFYNELVKFVDMSNVIPVLYTVSDNILNTL